MADHLTPTDIIATLIGFLETEKANSQDSASMFKTTPEEPESAEDKADRLEKASYSEGRDGAFDDVLETIKELLFENAKAGKI
jgi:hypothetical protein